MIMKNFLESSDHLDLMPAEVRLNCDRPPASTCDRCLVHLLRLQWIQTRKDIRSCNSSVPAPLQQALEQVAMIIVAIDGQIQFISQQAEHLLNQYALTHPSQRLPDPVNQWFHQQLAQLALHHHDPSTSSPLHFEQSAQQLIIRLVSGTATDHFCLLLEERSLPCLSVVALEGIGLTKREAEILFWVAKDKSNAEIAKLLSCSEGTVRKHLEHLHRKLNVQTRTAAVMVALERLGLVQV
jgi:DNA-binding CsgD family transcriptional regulator